MAAAQAERQLVYSCFRQDRFADQFQNLYSYLSDERITVGELYSYLQHFVQEKRTDQLFDSIKSCGGDFLRCLSEHS